VIGSSLGPSESCLTVQSKRRANTSKHIDLDAGLDPTRPAAACGPSL